MPDIEGTGFEGRAPIIRAHVKDNMHAFLIRDRDNKHDPNAIGVFIQTPGFFGFGGGLRQIGFVDRDRAAKMAPLMDAGQRYDASIRSHYNEMKHPRVTVSWSKVKDRGD